jgi:hypothetical protein
MPCAIRDILHRGAAGAASHAGRSSRTGWASAAISAALVASGVGCQSASDEIQRTVDAAEHVAPGVDAAVARMYLGFPTRLSPDQRLWWYLWPDARGPDAPHGGVSVLIRLDASEAVVAREVCALYAPDATHARLYAAHIATETAADDDVRFAEALKERMVRLAKTTPRYRFAEQVASCQLLADEMMLISMDEWTQPGSRMVTVRGELDPTEHPQLYGAIKLAWQIRRFAIELELGQ